VRLAEALDVRREVVGQRKQEARADLLGYGRGVEHDQWRIGEVDGRRAVEQRAIRLRVAGRDALADSPA
jgi:hypothetical protein